MSINEYVLKKFSLTLFFLLNFLSLNVSVLSADGSMLSYGVGMDDTLVQSKSITGAKQVSLGVFWKTNFSYQKDLFKYDELEIETYISQIEKQQSMTLISLRPVFSFWQGKKNQQNWYWQFGVGLSYFDSKELQPIKFSTHAQFATIFGIGIPLDKNQQHRLTLRYNHYSNAYIKRPNSGLDTLSLDWHWRFDH